MAARALLKFLHQEVFSLPLQKKLNNDLLTKSTQYATFVT